MKCDLTEVVNLYKSKRGLIDLDIEIHIVEDMNDAYYKYLPEKLSSVDKQDKELLLDFNGIVTLPEKLYGTYVILLNRNFVKNSIESENFGFVETIFHELTHVYDHYFYMKLLGIEDYCKLPEQNNYNIFVYWTEFNSRYVGYSFFREKCFGDLYSTEIIQFLKDKEIQYYVDSYINEYQKTSDGGKQVYEVMQFLGRVKVWKETYPDLITFSFIKEMLKENLWAYNLFIFLSEYERLENIFYKFDEMKSILKQNFVFSRNGFSADL